MEISELQTIEHPNAEIAQLRFKVGHYFTRPAVYPILNDSGRLEGFRTSTDRVTCFRVLGFGETEKAAKRMAQMAEKIIQIAK